MPAYRLHGLAVASWAAPGPDPVDALLAPFRDVAAAMAPPDLAILVRPWTEPPRAAAPGAPEAPAPAFTHGDLAVAPSSSHGTLAVTSPRAALEVDPGGTAVRGRYAPPADARALELLANVDLFVALTLALHARGLFHLHAAALVAPSGASLAVAGTASCGKSTLAAALVAAGCAYLGDDVALATRRGDAVRLLAFPRPFHLAEASARAVPAAGARLLAGEPAFAGKRWLDPAAAFPGAARLDAPAPAALLFPEIVDAEVSAVEPLSAAEGLGRLLASSLFAMTRLGTTAQRALLADVAAGARPYAVRLGRDLLRDAVGTAARIAAAAGVPTAGATTPPVA
jgi:hypothetical protein